VVVGRWAGALVVGRWCDTVSPVDQQWLKTLAIVVGIVAIALLVLIALAIRSDRRSAAGRHAKTRPSRDSFRQVEEEEPPPKKRAAVIVNPTKVESMAELRERLEAAMAAQDWDVPMVLETTAEDPGLGQTRAALEAGVDLVCAMGGDGTVRAVAQELAHTTTPMGLLPAGTGNLLARNLLVPMDSLEAAVAVATGGRNRHIDVGWITLDPPMADGEVDVTETEVAEAAEGEAETTDEITDTTLGSSQASPSPETDAPIETVTAPLRRAFLVMAGMGFDARVMEDTSEEFKARVGWAAYFAQGAKHILRPRFTTTLIIDGGKPITCKARTVLAGNCGRLTGGIQLMPDAVVDDGELNVVAITAKGIYGLAGAATHILARKPESHAQLDRWTARRLEVHVEEAQKVEIDGDVIGEANRSLIEVEPRSLIVRVSTSVPATPALAD
jgi:diacylglycerol kinase (ATP)